MQLHGQAEINGSAEDVLAVAGPVERWSLLLRAYHHVRFIARDGNTTVAQFTVWRGALRLNWTVERTVYPAERRLVFRHIRGFAAGLQTEWRLTEEANRVHVAVTHVWRPAWPIVGDLWARAVTALIIQPLTHETVAQIGQVVAEGRAAPLRRLAEALRDRNEGGIPERGD